MLQGIDGLYNRVYENWRYLPSPSTNETQTRELKRAWVDHGTTFLKLDVKVTGKRIGGILWSVSTITQLFSLIRRAKTPDGYVLLRLPFFH